MPNLMQVPGNWLRDQLTSLQAEAEKRRVEISTTNGLIVAANTRAASITDPAKRAVVQDAFRKLALKQAGIVKQWRTWWGNIDTIATKVKTWLNANGLDSSLNGFGILPVVLGIPLELFALLTVGASVWLVNEWIKNANAAALTYAQNNAHITDAYLKGQISDAQFKAATASADSAAKSSPPPGDPLGLTGALKAAMPVVLLIVGALVAPNLISAARSVKRRVA